MFRRLLGLKNNDNGFKCHKLYYSFSEECDNFVKTLFKEHEIDRDKTDILNGRIRFKDGWRMTFDADRITRYEETRFLSSATMYDGRGNCVGNYYGVQPSIETIAMVAGLFEEELNGLWG